MTPAELKEHKNAIKTLVGQPAFKPLKRGKLPRPFHRMGGSRYYATDIIELSDTYRAVFIYKDGPILSDTAFFGHMLCCLANKSLYPLFEFHWHPSHKGFHAKLPCRTDLDYTDRMLPGAPELRLTTIPTLDPRSDKGRAALIETFCIACGISITSQHDPATKPLWK